MTANNQNAALMEARDFLASLIEFTKPLDNFDGYTRLALSAHEMCNRIPEAIAKIDATLDSPAPQAEEADLVKQVAELKQYAELYCHLRDPLSDVEGISTIYAGESMDEVIRADMERKAK
jgi:hypothetical protein